MMCRSSCANSLTPISYRLVSGISTIKDETYFLRVFFVQTTLVYMHHKKYAVGYLLAVITVTATRGLLPNTVVIPAKHSLKLVFSAAPINPK